MHKTMVLRVATLAVVGTLAGLAPAAAAPAGACVTAQVPSSFRLPDGVLRPAGTLTLCDTRKFSPVASLHTIFVDRRPIGMFLSRRRNAEAIGEASPEIAFERDAAGTLDLMGYVLPTRGPSVVYLMTRPERRPAFGETVARVDVSLTERRR